MGFAIRPLAFGESLDFAFALLRASWRQILVVAALLWVPVIAVQQLGFLPMVQAAATAGALAGLGATALQMLLMIIISAPCATAVAVVLADTYLGRRGDLAHVARRTRAMLWMVLYTDVLLELYTMLGFLFFFLPGLWLTLHYALAGTVVVIEQRSGPAALRRSYELTRGARGRATLLLLAAIALAGALSAGPIWALGGMPTARRVMILSVTLLAGWLIRAVLTVFYFDRVCRREAFDIEHLARLVEARDGASPVVS